MLVEGRRPHQIYRSNPRRI